MLQQKHNPLKNALKKFAELKTNHCYDLSVWMMMMEVVQEAKVIRKVQVTPRMIWNVRHLLKERILLFQVAKNVWIYFDRATLIGLNLQKKVQYLYKDAGTEAIESALLDFMKSITLLDISPKDKKIIKQSCTAYFASKKACEKEYNIAERMIVSESESGEDEYQLWTSNEDVLEERGRAVLVKKRAALKRKTVCEIKKKVAERRFLKRRWSKKMLKIVKDYPEIGIEIEKFVKDCGVGADAWRRTGILTFDGNRKLQKKATFKRIKEHLEQVYQRTFAYGTVMQLCVARNKQRKSAERCQGLANMTQRCAGKGFNTKFNPDYDWSNAFYAALDIMQYKDGRSITNLGRDDQAGFRLDTMATHKLHPTLCVKGREHITTYTDYTTKYPSKIQTTSIGTNFTREKCCSAFCRY